MSLRLVRFENVNAETIGYVFMDASTDLGAYVQACELGLVPEDNHAAEARQMGAEFDATMPAEMYGRLLSPDEYDKVVAEVTT